MFSCGAQFELLNELGLYISEESGVKVKYTTIHEKHHKIIITFIRISTYLEIMARVVVGGTFEFLHDGHRELLRKSFEIADDGKVDIGLTSNDMASMKQRDVPDYLIRKRRLVEYINKISKEQIYNIIELNDPYGNTLSEDYDFIVVSPETLPVALKINELRRQRGMEEIDIVNIGYILADDKIPISSTRIIKGEIDIHGHLRPHTRT